jgi:hypothetical protein
MSKAFWEGFWCGANPMVHISWLLYLIGHAFSLALNKADSAFWCRVWYAPYNRLMSWSVRAQGNSKCGPWEPA